MKNMKKLLQKAMVFTLAAAMLVGTPLTASAAPLVDLYSISDGTAPVDPTDKTPTGTITNTDTGSGVLIENNAAQIVGIVLDKKTVKTEVGEKETLKATVVLNGKIEVNEDGTKKDITDQVIAEMSQKIKWEVLYLDEDGNKLVGEDVPNPAEKVGLELKAGDASDRSVVTLTGHQGTDKAVTVRASIDASYYYMQSDGEQNTDKIVLGQDNAKAGIYYKADATVTVKEYSTGLAWDDNKTESTLPVKHTLDLGAMLKRTPATANDTITWTSSNTKVATVNKNGVVTAKKTSNTAVTITAVGEHGAKATRTITVNKGVKADIVKIYINDTDKTGKTTEIDLATAESNAVIAEAKMYVKVKAYVQSVVADEGTGVVVVNPGTEEAGAEVTPPDGAELKNNVVIEDGQWYIDKDGKAQQVNITDEITWSSKKTAIATVADGTVTLKGVGSTDITAKATNGKSAKTTVKVKATLNSLAIGGIESNQVVYSGQTINLTALRNGSATYPNKDEVKWSIVKVDGRTNSNAKIDSKKGVLKIEKQLKANFPTVTIHLETKNKVKTNEDGTKEKITAKDVTINVAQSSVDVITVTEEGAGVVAKGGYGSNDSKLTGNDAVSGKTSKINVPLNKTFVATVENNQANSTAVADASLLTWKSSKTKVAKIELVDGKAKITAVGPGTAKITVSGIRANDASNKQSVSVSFNVSVKQPVTSFTMNKPAVTLPAKKNVKASLKVTFGPKNASDKNDKKIVSWTVRKPDGTEEVIKKSNGKNYTSTSYTLKLTRKPTAGDVYTITAKSATGLTATSTITIAEETKSVAIAKEAELNSNNKPVKFGSGKTTLYLSPEEGRSNTVQLYPFIQLKNGSAWKKAGEDNCEGVTYSVNKKGIVTVDKNGKVYAVKKGTVTITAKTPTGKKTTLKVTVR